MFVGICDDASGIASRTRTLGAKVCGCKVFSTLVVDDCSLSMALTPLSQECANFSLIFSKNEKFVR